MAFHTCSIGLMLPSEMFRQRPWPLEQAKFPLQSAPQVAVVSSLPSPQWGNPLHFHADNMHWPLEQRKYPSGQACFHIYISIFHFERL